MIKRLWSLKDKFYGGGIEPESPKENILKVGDNKQKKGKKYEKQ